MGGGFPPLRRFDVLELAQILIYALGYGELAVQGVTDGTHYVVGLMEQLEAHLEGTAGGNGVGAVGAVADDEVLGACALHFHNLGDLAGAVAGVLALEGSAGLGCYSLLALGDGNYFAVHLGADVTHTLFVAAAAAQEQANLGALDVGDVKIISGGPMMGFGVFELDLPTTKTASALLCLTRDEVSEMEPSACINCGRCKSRCPYGLDVPNLLKQNLEGYNRILKEETSKK